MAASAETRYYTGSSPGSAGANVIGSAVRYKRADDGALDLTAAVPKPDSGENLSWRKHCKMNWPSTPAGSISNLRWFVASVPTAVKLYSKTSATYTQASASDESGIASFTDSQPNKDANDETVRTSTTPLSVNSGTVLANPSTGEGTQDYVMSQGGIKSTYAGSPGPSTQWTQTYRYNET